MGRLPSRIAELTAHCDLEERLVSVPPSAMVRGLYFKNTVRVLSEAGKLDEYNDLFQDDYSSVRWYPTSDFLIRLAVGGALLASPEEIHAGMQEIGRRNAVAFAESLIGRTMLRLLSKDPHKLLKQACAGRRQSYRYGRWEADVTGERQGVMRMYEEYIWMESNLLGAALGTFQSIGLSPKVEYELVSPFEGRHFVSW